MMQHQLQAADPQGGGVEVIRNVCLLSVIVHVVRAHTVVEVCWSLFFWSKQLLAKPHAMHHRDWIFDDVMDSD